MRTFSIISILLILIVPFFNLSAQTLELQRLRSDYPKSTQRFPLGKQSATYVFAVDFSSSMRGLEREVKQSLQLFINSLPDGDRITLIKEGETASTDYIYIPNAVISSESKRAIINNFNNVPFNENGSDGYKLAEKIIEAIDQTGGNELIYIFIFTDFEYYTRLNGYNKVNCDWNKLVRKYTSIQKGRKIIKIGLELPAVNLRPAAIFKSDLDIVFQGVNYFRIVDGNSLSNWFADTRANILRDRLKFIVEKKIEKELACAEFHVKPLANSSPECWVKSKDCELLNSFTFIGPDELLKGGRPWIEWPFSKNKIKKGEINLTFNDSFKHTKGYNEIEKLLPDSQLKTVSLIIHKPEAYISWLVALIIILVLISIVVCVIITCTAKKAFSSLRIYAEWYVDNRMETESKTFNSVAHLLIGYASDSKGFSVFEITEVSKQIEIFYKNNCPCKFWIKPGVYIKAKKGNNIKFKITGKREEKVLMQDSVAYLSPGDKFMGVTITFEENSIQYSIKIR